MSQVPVIAIRDPAQLPAALAEEHDRHVEARHAAECPSAVSSLEGMEDDGSQLTIVTHRPAGAAHRLHVIAFPREIFVEGEAPEYSERIPLSVEINPESVSAALDKDLVTITAKAKAFRQGA